MRKYFSILLIFFCSFAPLGRAQTEKPLRIVTTFYPLYIMTLNVVGNTPNVDVANLTPPVTGCLHDYSLTTNDMKKLADADILVANGAGMESFLEQVIRQFPKLKVIRATSGMKLIESPSGTNPHVWVSIPGAIEEVRNIEAGLETMAPLETETYRDNAGNYISQLMSLQERMEKALAHYRGERIVTFHEAFPYFAKEFGFKIAAVVEREPGSEPSAKELADTIDLVKKSGIKVIFSEPQYPANAAEAISRETSAKILVLDPAVTGPLATNAYLQIMERNFKTLEEAFR